MRKQTRVSIIYISIIIIGLLGVSFAGWTDINKIVASISTGYMDYDFQESGNSLTLIRGSSSYDINANICVENGKYLKIYIIDPKPIINMKQGDKLRIEYKLKEGEEGNVPLKAKKEDLGLISIALKPETICWSCNGLMLTESDYANLVPDNLGVFKAYHYFDGLGGVIEMISESFPTKPVDSLTFDYSGEVNEPITEEGEDNTKIEESTPDSDWTYDRMAEDISLPDDNLNEMNDVFLVEEEALQGEEIPSYSSEDISDGESDSQGNKEKQHKKNKGTDDNKKGRRKFRISKETISFKAEYEFVIPLKYDQFNAN